MKRIAETLLRSVLRRYPIPTRISLVTYLGQYAWLKDILEELRPELFPPRRDQLVATTADAIQKPDASVLGILERSEICGRLAYYKAETYCGQRGNGHLFGGVEIKSKRPVTIKEYFLPAAKFTKTEALQRQNRFQQLAGFQLADGRLQEFRVIQPLEAIADSESQELCFLVTEARDRAPTLRQHLHNHGPLPPPQARDVLSQLLQTLDFLHNQKFSFPIGASQDGLIHGNLSLDTVLWTQPSQPYVYLCDLLLWEQGFDPTVTQWRSTQATPDTIQLDLRAVGEIGVALLQGVEPGPTAAIEPHLRQILDSLQTGQFNSAETARRELLQLAARSPDTIAPLDDITAQSDARKSFPVLLGLSLLALLVGAFVLVPRLRSTEARSTPPPPVSTCCLAEVSAIPVGEFTYTSVQNGTWWTVLQQRNLLQRGQSLSSALQANQPKLQLRYAPTAAIAQVLEQVRSGAVDFAVLPMLDDLPADLLAQEIAYDGLATVVSFSYSERQQGLPTALNGRLTLEQVQQLYDGQVDQWKTIGGPPIRVRRYAAANPEAIAVFEQRVLNSRKLQTLTNVQQLPAIDLLRQVIRDFEEKGIGSVGIAPLSEIAGQCSVYPLALGLPGQAAVQPIVLSNGQAIEPETDLCKRKGAYAPAPDRIQTGSYPLSYPIVVVYPRNNRRSAIGKKFVELMRTIEGQRLLRAAGLVPMSRSLPRPSPTPTSK